MCLAAQPAPILQAPVSRCILARCTGGALMRNAWSAEYSVFRSLRILDARQLDRPCIEFLIPIPCALNLTESSVLCITLWCPVDGDPFKSGSDSLSHDDHDGAVLPG